MKNEGFTPPIYGLQPLKMKVLGSHGAVYPPIYPFFLISWPPIKNGIKSSPQDQWRSVAPSPTSSHAWKIGSLKNQGVKVDVNRMSWNSPTIHVSKHAMLTLITDKSDFWISPFFPLEIPSFESGCSSHLCLVYWSVKEMHQDFAKSQPYEVYVDVGVPKCQSTILETNSEFTPKRPKDHLQCFPLFVWMGAM